MITLSAVQGRIKRQKIRELAGTYFVEGSQVQEKIPYLRDKTNEQFLFGIYERQGKWTVLSVTNIFASFDCEPFEINIIKESRPIFDHYGLRINIDKNVELEGGKTIWLHPPRIPNSFQNILLMLRKLPENAVLET